MATYNEIKNIIGPGPEDDGMAILISGQLPSGEQITPPSQLYGVNDRGEIVPFLVERVTTGFPVITTDHALIHAGIAYTLSGIVTFDGTYNLQITTPADKYVHFKPVGITASGGPVTVIMYEDASASDGSALIPRNRNRVIDNPDNSTMTCKRGVSFTGTKDIATLFIPSATNGAQKLGASSSAAEEIVLHKSTTYVISMTETSTGSVTIGYDLFWYEEPSA